MSQSLIFPHFLFFGERCEWIAHFTQIKWGMWANPSGCSPKMSDHEQFAQVAQRKWAIMSELLWLLTKNERMSQMLIFWANRSFAHFSTKNVQFAQKSNERIPEFPALIILWKLAWSFLLHWRTHEIQIWNLTFKNVILAFLAVNNVFLCIFKILIKITFVCLL